MGLPLPRVVADVGPGGGLVTAMGGINSLNNDMLLRKINSVKAQYAPLTTQAEAASKLAYANLMGPQFLAKIMGNDSALANMSEEQKKSALERIYQAGSGQGSGNVFNQMSSGVGQPSTNSLSGWIADKFKNSFGSAPPQRNGNALGGSASNPGQYNAPAEYSSPPAPRGSATTGYDNSSNPGVSAEGPGFIPEGQNPFVARAGYNPTQQDDNSNPMQMEMTGGQEAPSREPTYAENTGNYKGIVEEGQESGKIRAKDIDELNNTVFNAETNATTLNKINDILGSPEFEGIRNTPLAGHHELAYYAKEGTKAQQDMVGQYYTLTGNLIKDASRDFAGQFRKGEQSLLQGMKPSPSDTVDTAKGKSAALTELNKMLEERSRLTSKYMSKNHANKLEASEWADRQVDGNQIRKDVHDRLNPTVTIRNRKTGESKTISVAEARKLGVPNV